MRRFWAVAVVSIAFVLIGCAGKSIRSYEGTSPRLEPEKFFDGRVEGWGFSENRWGSVNEWFEVEFRGETTGDTSVWHETIRFEDGRVDERTWRIVRRGDQEYSVEPTGKISEGTGVAYGSTVRWNYYLDVTYGGGEWTLWVDDWMHKKSEDTVVVRANLSRFGLTLGYGYMFLRKVE